jgi:hypothetical protein
MAAFLNETEYRRLADASRQAATEAFGWERSFLLKQAAHFTRLADSERAKTMPRTIRPRRADNGSVRRYGQGQRTSKPASVDRTLAAHRRV